MRIFNEFLYKLITHLIIYNLNLLIKWFTDYIISLYKMNWKPSRRIDYSAKLNEVINHEYHKNITILSEGLGYNLFKLLNIF